MKKIFTLASMFLFAGWAAMAQNAIPNPDMEAWSGGNPTGWTTLNSFVPGSCTQGTSAGDFHGGASASILTTKNAGTFGVVPGTMATGTLDIFTQQFTGGVDFALRPDSLVGWYKYVPQGNDAGATVNVFLLRNSGNDTVGVGNFTALVAQPNWTRFAVKVNYFLTGDPEKAIFIATSGQASGGIVDTKMYVDDLDLIYLPTVGISNTDKGSISSYPNPVVDKVSFNLGSNNTAKVSIFNIIGGRVLDAKLSKENKTITIGHLPAGTYVWQMRDANDNIIKTDKLVLTK